MHLVSGAALTLALVTAAPAPPDTNPGPTGRGRIVVVPQPDPLDPLGDPAWHRRDRHLRIATGALGAASSAALLTFTTTIVSRNGDDLPPEDPSIVPYVALGAGAGALVATAVVAALLDRHHREALRYRSTSPDLRSDRRWISRDRALRGGLVASASIGSAGILCMPIAFANTNALVVTGSITTAIGVGGVIAAVILATRLRRHRKQLTRWPRFGVSGLTMQF